MAIPDLSWHNPIEDPPDELDAFGHLNWTVSEQEDQPDGGEWMACFDAIYNPSTGLVDYHIVVDTGSYTGTPEQGSVNAADIGSLKDLPEYWHYIGVEQGLLMDENVLATTRERWSVYLDELKEKIPQVQPNHETGVEESLDYFDRYIAGDR